MSEDISHILDSWKYDPDNAVRIIKADDNRDVMQVRQPLGIEQYELDGRPDGKRPFGRETFLDEMFQRRENFFKTHAETMEYHFGKEELQMLQNEGVLFYYRYLNLFQISDYKRVTKDTEHNLKLCDFVEKHAEDQTEARNILQYRPYIIRVNAISHAMISLNSNVKSVAQQVLEDAIREIKELTDVDTPTYQFEKIRSLNYLRVALKQVLEKKIDPVTKLRKELDEAIEAEEYERAANIRDRLRELSDE
jgi:hypothetical protein